MVSSRFGFPLAFLFVFTGCHPNSPATVLAPLGRDLFQEPTNQASGPQYLSFADKLTATVFKRLRHDARYKIVPAGTPFTCPSRAGVGAQGYALSARVISVKGNSAIASIRCMCETLAYEVDYLLVRDAGEWKVDKRLSGAVIPTF